MAGMIVNGTDADIATFGGGAVTAVKRATTDAAATTDAQLNTGAQAAHGIAVIKAAQTNAGKIAIAGVLIDEVISSVDLSTPAKRKAFRLKAGVQELKDILYQLGA